MAFKDTLESGSLGLTLHFPDDWKLAADEEHHLQIVDYSRGALWWVFFVPALNMDLTESPRVLSERAGHHARHMFNTAYEADSIQHNRPRTDDPQWSPLISCELIDLREDVKALETLHRMHYRPGRETILGHVVIPRASGLIEARVLTVDEQTGMREALLTAAMMKSDEGGMGGAMATEDFKHPGQAYYDSQEHDPKFADHCLSRARDALRWFRDEARLALGAQRLVQPCGQTDMPDVGCSLAPPRGFYRVTTHPGLFTRTAFGATDGFEQFFVERHEMEVTPRDLATVAKDRTLRICHGASIDVADCHVVADIECQGRNDVLVVVEGTSFEGKVRNAVHWLLDEHGTPWSFGRTGSAATPQSVLAAELKLSAQSWRRL